MKLMQKIKKIFMSFENLLSDEHCCISCGREIPDGLKFQLCHTCENLLDVIGTEVCAKCGERLLEGNLLCEHCKDFDYDFNTSKSYCYYDDISARIVKGLKYNDRKYYAKHIAKMMTEDKSVFENVDVITFVPMGSKGLRKRGFNQAQEIANEISKLVNIPVLKLLSKAVEHKNQAGLSQQERLKNLKDSFEVFSENESEIKGKNILIIDDVFTTGTTLSECSKTLKRKKPKSVCALTFAKTKFNSIN